MVIRAVGALARWRVGALRVRRLTRFPSNDLEDSPEADAVSGPDGEAERANAPTRQRANGAKSARAPNAERGTLLAVLALAAIVRLWGLGSQPVLYFDSGVYLGEGAFLASAAQRAASSLLEPDPTGHSIDRVARTLESGTDGHPPDIAKPGHAILLAVSMLLLGKTALAGGLVSALAGLGTVALTYGIGVHGWGRRVAIAAAVLLAISGQHLVYSREPLVEADGLFFATLAALVYLRATSARGVLLAGVVWGVAFSCNNRLSYLPAVLLLAELARWSGWRALARRGAALSAGFVAPLVAIEGAYLLARGIGRGAGARTDWLDYVQQLAAFSRMNPPDRLRLDQWPTYFVDLALMDGLPVLGLLGVGIAVLVWRLARRRPWSMADVLLAGMLLAPLAIYSVYSTGEVRLRHFSLALPWVMLAAALGLQWLAGLVKRQAPRALSAAVVVLTILALPRVTALTFAPSGMRDVLAAVDERPAASTNGPVLAFFLGEGRTNARLREAFINSPADLHALAEKYPLLVVDMQAAVFAGELTELYTQATPILTVPNGSDAWYLADLLEHYGIRWGGWNDLLAKWQANREVASQLRVYDLRALTVRGTSSGG